MSVRTVEPWEFAGGASFPGGATFPNGSVDDASVAVGAAIDEAKVNHRKQAIYTTGAAVEAAAATQVVYCAYRSCTVLGVKGVAVTAAAGGDKKATIDVKKSTAGGAFASILTAAFDLPNGGTDLVPVDGTLSGTPTLVADDLLEVVVTVSGSTGTQNEGVSVFIDFYELGTS
jgi:hypothetical protein